MTDNDLLNIQSLGPAIQSIIGEDKGYVLIVGSFNEGDTVKAYVTNSSDTSVCHAICDVLRHLITKFEGAKHD